MSTDQVLAVAAEAALVSGTRMLEPVTVERACAEQGIGREAWLSALIALRDQQLVQLAAEPAGVALLAITNAGLLRHLERIRPDLSGVRARLAAAVTEAEGRGAVPLSESVGEPALLVECLLDDWVAARRLVYSQAPGRRFRVHRVLGSL